MTAKINPKLVESVNLAVEAYVGEAVLSVAELSALKPDGLVALDGDLNRLVELRVNGVVVAHGELVAIEDKFGVRITHVDS